MKGEASMNGEHISVVWGNILSNFVLLCILGYMISRWMKSIETKLVNFCKNSEEANKAVLVKIEKLQEQVAGKISKEEHHEVEVELGKIGNRLIKLEIKAKIIEDQ
jgi:hypothetical protein